MMAPARRHAAGSHASVRAAARWTLSFDIDERAGWPEELRVLLERHPRSTWGESRSPLARFWLEKHDGFRHQARELEAANADFRAERSSARDFAIRVAPRLQTFIAYLHGHHQIEDYHYFPAFMQAEPRLTAGFETLERDHVTLAAGIEDVVRAANELVEAVRSAGDGDGEPQRHAGRRYADACGLLCGRLLRHLDDEEDLIIPLMLERR